VGLALWKEPAAAAAAAAAALTPVRKAKVGPENGFGLVQVALVALFEQQGAERVSHGLHEPPWLIVSQRVVTGACIAARAQTKPTPSNAKQDRVSFGYLTANQHPSIKFPAQHLTPNQNGWHLEACT
jgi:hypothetical protein